MQRNEAAHTDRRKAVEALRVARENLRNPESKLAMLLMAYANGQEAGTAKWVLPDA